MAALSPSKFSQRIPDSWELSFILVSACKKQHCGQAGTRPNHIDQRPLPSTVRKLWIVPEKSCEFGQNAMQHPGLVMETHCILSVFPSVVQPVNSGAR